MATSSRQSKLFGINDWKSIYQTFSEANFKAVDYETLRKSFIDYIRLKYPENFNDYTESSEFIALLDVIAFMGQSLSFRSDLNTRENFIDTAERRDSVIKLANLVSYNPKRSLSGQGYLKVTSIRTTENLTDVNGINLNNVTVLWNDPANNNWLNQFNTIINSSLINSQRVGRPGNSKTILGVKTDEYSISIPSSNLPVIPFSSTVDNISMNFEIVSVTSLNQDYIYEIPPNPIGRMNLLYRNDKLGYGSPNTGFFFYFKQGNLQSYDFTIQQQISNRVVDIGDIEGVNNTDTWLYQIDNNRNELILWDQVESVYANIGQTFDSNSERKLYSVVSRFNDQVSYAFGDGVFSEMPTGLFRAYVRNSNSLTYTIDQSEFQGINVSLQYISRNNKVETLTFGLELQQPVNNAVSRESLPSIKQRAPTRFYTQNRMVNGEDYSNFPYTKFGSIIKSRALNRSSIGISRNLDLLDPTQKYSSTNCFSDDGALYIDDTDNYIELTINSLNDIIRFLNNTLPTLLNSSSTRQYYSVNSNRYDPSTDTTARGFSNGIYWNLSSTNSNNVTGYFYKTEANINIPVSLGVYTTTLLKYITKGAMIKLSPPSGYYFDNNNRLTRDTKYENKTYIWVNVLSVSGDGYNFGSGTFDNGSGPVVLSSYVPTGVKILEIIPSFSNTLPSSVLQQCVTKMNLNQNFSLVFDDSLLSNQTRWFIRNYNDPNYFVNFRSDGNNKYTIVYKSLKYYFGSEYETRFVYSNGKLTYDPYSGKTLRDYVKVLSSNSNPTNNLPLGIDYELTVINQRVESDGYINDFEVEISNIDVADSNLIINPDFFTEITGYTYNSNNTNRFVFFKRIQDPVNLTRYEIIPNNSVNYEYSSIAQIEMVRYDYPLGQLFYAHGSGLFYKTVLDNSVIGTNYLVIQQDDGAYLVKSGRQSLYFQYRHNSDNTKRIDPATTNIIDLYVVTQSYYDSYVKWLQDTTNTVSKPSIPSINQLNSDYNSGVTDYKMISDSIIFNSVTFKPLFGNKAAKNLQGTIKVIRASNTTASDTEIRSAVLSTMNDYFNINNWNFGDTFYFSELSSYLHTELGDLISSIVLVPKDPQAPFGTLFEVKCSPYEIFVNGALPDDIVIISAITQSQL